MVSRASNCERRAFRGRRHDLVREPDAGDLHVRIDERRLETESWRGVRHRHQRKPPATATPYRLPLPRQLPTLPFSATDPLIAGHDFGALIADKAFDADWIIEELQRREAEVVISQHPKRTAPREIDREVYKWRHRIENYFGKLKEYKRIATRAASLSSA